MLLFVFNVHRLLLNIVLWFVSIPVASTGQWRRQNFSAAGAQPGQHSLDWGTFEKYAKLSPTL